MFSHVGLSDWVTQHALATRLHIPFNPRSFLGNVYVHRFLHYFVSSADFHDTNSFPKFAHFINMEKKLFIILALSSTIYAGKLIHNISLFST